MAANFSTFAFPYRDVSSVGSVRRLADHTHEFFVLGMLAQLVQSACFTRMRSLVRIQYIPQGFQITIFYPVCVLVCDSKKLAFLN